MRTDFVGTYIAIGRAPLTGRCLNRVRRRIKSLVVLEPQFCGEEFKISGETVSGFGEVLKKRLRSVHEMLLMGIDSGFEDVVNHDQDYFDFTNSLGWPCLPLGDPTSLAHTDQHLDGRLPSRIEAQLMHEVSLCLRFCPIRAFETSQQLADSGEMSGQLHSPVSYALGHVLTHKQAGRERWDQSSAVATRWLHVGSILRCAVRDERLRRRLRRRTSPRN